ncbi:alpha-L-glutamate ligase, RimK family, partial [Reticulomyxa filosa]
RRGAKIEPEDILEKHNMKLPLVLKVLNTSGGRGVFLARDEKELCALLRMSQFGASHIELIAQEFLEESKGMDVRVWVIGDKAYGACKRFNETDFRSNVGQGGFPHAFELDEEGKQIAVRASMILGLDWSGVDLLLAHKDPVTGKCHWRVGEVNSSPGWDKDSDKLIDYNLGDIIVEHICHKYNIETPIPKNDK